MGASERSPAATTVSLSVLHNPILESRPRTNTILQLKPNVMHPRHTGTPVPNSSCLRLIPWQRPTLPDCGDSIPRQHPRMPPSEARTPHPKKSPIFTRSEASYNVRHSIFANTRTIFFGCVPRFVLVFLDNCTLGSGVHQVLGGDPAKISSGEG